MDKREYVLIAKRHNGGAERFGCYIMAANLKSARELFLGSPLSNDWVIAYCGPSNEGRKIKSWFTLV